MVSDKDASLGETRENVHMIAVHYFLQLYMNLQLFKNEKFNEKNNKCYII